MYNLGGVLKDLGEIREAKKILEEALLILKNVFPPNHPKVQLTQTNLDWLKNVDVQA